MSEKPYQSDQSRPNVTLVKFYLAAGLADREKAAGVISRLLRSENLTCTYDWTVHGSVKGDGHERMSQVAVGEVSGVSSADFFVLLAPGGRGAHVELGIALALAIPALVVYEAAEDDVMKPYPSVFHHHPGVSRLHVSSVGENDGAYWTEICRLILEWRNNFYVKKGG